MWKISASILLVILIPVLAHADPISWRVKHRFRLFDEDVRTAAVEQVIFKALNSASTNLNAFDAYKVILRADRPENAHPLYKFTHYQRTTSGLYDDGYVTPKFQVVSTKLAIETPKDAKCTWSVQSTGIVVSQPCSSEVDLQIPFDAAYVAASDVSVSVDANPVQPPYLTHIVSRDRIVISMGDSYAAGEGAPDRPADLSKIRLGTAFRVTDWWNPKFQPANGVLSPSASADWWSNECHRSLFSSHALAALRMASTDERDSVTYLAFACSGAAVLDGLIASQYGPPGEGRSSAMGISPVALRTSQLDQAFLALCQTGYSHTPLPLPDGMTNWSAIYYQTNKNPNGTLPSGPHCLKWKRKPDLLFLSIGGNDIGFAGLAAWAALPQDKGLVSGIISRNIGAFAGSSWNKMSVVCPSIPYPAPPSAGPSDPRCPFPNNVGLLSAQSLYQNDLPNLLDFAYQAIQASGLVSPSQIIHVAYPAPFTDENRMPCGTLRGAAYPKGQFKSASDLGVPWYAELSEIPTADFVQLGVTADRASAIEKIVFTGLLKTINQHTNKAGAIYAPLGSTFETHGLCAVSKSLEQDFWFPKTSNILGFGWGLSGPPSRWDAYQRRQRWVNVSNDSLLTQMTTDVSGKVSDESLSGTIHPSAEGYAAISDYIFAAIPLESRTPVSSDTPTDAPLPAAPQTSEKGP